MTEHPPRWGAFAVAYGAVVLLVFTAFAVLLARCGV
ncbi:hypothetical protein HNR25_004004 [Streptomonospora salina]|uniref:Uncharacterized protein n=1 Tax=Streptomonospora salina TaxID=104205 RepID=A0A841EGU9_9ACTN|nr:hypothetical protein [Streptomonospora salina]